MRPKHKAKGELVVVVVALAVMFGFLLLGGAVDCGTIGPPC